jgi:hypothetical protein
MDSTVAVLTNELALVARATAEPAVFAVLYDHYFARVYNYVRLPRFCFGPWLYLFPSAVTG